MKRRREVAERGTIGNQSGGRKMNGWRMEKKMIRVRTLMHLEIQVDGQKNNRA